MCFVTGFSYYCRNFDHVHLEYDRFSSRHGRFHTTADYRIGLSPGLQKGTHPPGQAVLELFHGGAVAWFRVCYCLLYPCSPS